jgi:Ca2+-binding EF-hand superfamily protein
MSRASALNDVIPDSQLRALKRAFEHYDTDQDGLITKDDGLPRALKAVGIVPTSEEFQGMCDSAPHQTIDLVAFVSIVYHFLRWTDTEEELERAFRGCARDPKKDSLPVDTAKQILLNLKHPLPEAQVDDLVKKLGRSGVIKIADMVKELLQK